MNDAGSGYDERAAAQPQHELAAPFDEKRDAPSSLESDSIQSQDRRAKGTEIAQPNETTDAEEAAGTSKEGEKLALQRSKSVTNAASIPDGGLVAWLQVLGAFFLLFNSWYVTLPTCRTSDDGNGRFTDDRRGIINTFGSYQAYYETDLLRSSNSSAISWIGSLQAFLLLFVGCLTGPVYDAGYFRTLLLSGSFFLVLGQMMLSLCKEYWQVLLAQAFCIGIGTGCLFVPSVAILSTYFTTKFAFAVGIAASGSSLGGVIYPIVRNPQCRGFIMAPCELY
jgi:hypothetical protein